MEILSNDGLVDHSTGEYEGYANIDAGCSRDFFSDFEFEDDFYDQHHHTAQARTHVNRIKEEIQFRRLTLQVKHGQESQVDKENVGEFPPSWQLLRLVFSFPFGFDFLLDGHNHRNS